MYNLGMSLIASIPPNKVARIRVCASVTSSSGIETFSSAVSPIAILSLLFEAKREIGVNPSTGVRFYFPLQTTMAFDYGLFKDSEQKLRQMFVNPKVVCKLDDNEYIDLVYAMYKSDNTPDEYKPFLNKVLEDFFMKN